MAFQQVTILSLEDLILSYLWEISVILSRPPWISYQRHQDYLILLLGDNVLSYQEQAHLVFGLMDVIIRFWEHTVYTC